MALYPTLNKAIAMVKAQAQIPSNDRTRDAYIKDILNASAGTINGVTEYRPYLVTAKVMWSSKSEQTLVRAEGDATFRQAKDSINLEPVIRDNLRTQQSFDISCGIEVPPGWDVQTLLDDLCGCEGDGEAVSAGVREVYSAMIV